MGDKVMQIKNNYQMEWELPTTASGIPVDKGAGVFNGDTWASSARSIPLRSW